MAEEEYTPLLIRKKRINDYEESEYLKNQEGEKDQE